MSIYAQLLSAAIERAGGVDESATTGEALAKLLECRRGLGIGVAAGDESDWTAIAIADQLAYDISLINLARRCGIEASPSRFEPPQRERVRLEQVLGTRGINLDEVFGLPVTDARSQSSGG
jgi:hypothetical protein